MNLGIKISLSNRFALYEPETLAYRPRVLAAGGEVISLADVDAFYKLLKYGAPVNLLPYVSGLWGPQFGVKKDGVGAVSVLYDMSSNNRDATQTTGSKQPVWIAAQKNGRAAISFNGSQYLSTSLVPAASATIIGVVKLGASGSSQIIIGARDNDNTRSSLATGTESTNYIAAGVGAQDNNTILGTTNFGAGNWVIEGLTYDGSTVSLFGNASTEYSAAQSGSAANTTYGYTLGAFNNKGSIIAGWTGSSADIIVFSAAQSAAIYQAMRNFLNTKYAVY